jgi:hypothetical protein
MCVCTKMMSVLATAGGVCAGRAARAAHIARRRTSLCLCGRWGVEYILFLYMVSKNVVMMKIAKSDERSVYLSSSRSMSAARPPAPHSSALATKSSRGGGHRALKVSFRRSTSSHQPQHAVQRPWEHALRRHLETRVHNTACEPACLKQTMRSARGVTEALWPR